MDLGKSLTVSLDETGIFVNFRSNGETVSLNVLEEAKDGTRVGKTLLNWCRDRVIEAREEDLDQPVRKRLLAEIDELMNSEIDV